MAQRIARYTTRHCSHCRQARAFLRRHGIPFREQDVEGSQRAFKELIGFDPKKLKKTLQKGGFEMQSSQ